MTTTCSVHVQDLGNQNDSPLPRVPVLLFHFQTLPEMFSLLFHNPLYCHKQAMILDSTHFAAYDLPLVHFSPRKRVKMLEEIMEAEVATTSKGENWIRRRQSLSGK